MAGLGDLNDIGKNGDVDHTARSPARFINVRRRQDENSRSPAISSPFTSPLLSSRDGTEPTVDITDDTVGGHYLSGGLPSHSVQWRPGLSPNYGDESSLLLKRFPPSSIRLEAASGTRIWRPGFQKHLPVPATVLFARDAAPLHLPKLDNYLSSFPPLKLSQNVDPSAPFPPMGYLAKLGLSLQDLETNRTKIPAWKNRNTVLGSAVNIVLGITVCSHWCEAGELMLL